MNRREVEIRSCWIVVLMLTTAVVAFSQENELPHEDPRNHWAFDVPVRPAVTKVKDSSWVRNPIDAFIASGHEQHRLTPRPPAKKEVLLRRVHLDLTGLPPTHEQLDAFLADDSPTAYEKVVDRLLDSQHYGERWGRHWMDVWRYSDWYGRRAANDVQTSSRQIWRWRDWIINSLNSDKGYDRMILEMLAGDEIAPEDPDVVVGTGFIVRNWYRLNFHTWKQDMVESTAKAFLGLTFNCAHCHDHKYDPITQENYFQLRAFFEPLMMRHDRLPNSPDPGSFVNPDSHSDGGKPVEAGLSRVYDGFPDAPTYMYHRGDPRNIMPGKPPVPPGVPEFLGGASVQIEATNLVPVAFYPGAKRFIRTEERQKRQQSMSSAETAFEKSQAELLQKQAALQTAIKNAEAEREVAEAALSQELQTPAPAVAVKPNPAAKMQLLAEWRFEGDEEEGILIDSSGNGLTLLRSTGNDKRVSAFPLPFSAAGSGFLRPIPHSGASNRQAASFDQRGGQSFFYAIAGTKLHADEFTLELYLQIDKSPSPQSGTLVDYEGVWAVEHQALNSSTSELRVRLRGAGGMVQEIPSNQGETPLTLIAGHDYYVAVVLYKQHVTFAAKNLTVAGELQSVQVPRSEEIRQLAEPGERASLNIGHSSRGRHRGLLDEVRLTRGGHALPEIDTRSAMSQHQGRLAKAEQALNTAREDLKLLHLRHTVLQLQFDDAQAQSSALEARIVADSARYVEKTPDAQTKALAANQAERAAAVSASKFSLAQAMLALAEAKRLLWSDPKQGPQITKAEQQLKQAREQVTTAIEKSLEPPSAEYTSLTQVFPQLSTGRRTALAGWIASRKNPLTARVAVNHIWLRHFGRAFVESVYDFGRNSKQPTHPPLMDWMAVEFMENGWKMKHLHRLIVTSNTYRMQSRADAQDRHNVAADPGNRFLWRFNERRMDAEIVRDSILASAGQLDQTMGGQDIDTKFGETIPRRSLYFTIHPEGGHLKFMSAFDPPSPLDCYRRDESVVPQQALAMTNSGITLKQSRLLAGKLWKAIEAKKPDESSRESAFISALFARILSRYPTSEEQLACREFLDEQVQLFQQTDAKQLAGTTPEGSVAPSTDPYIRAREGLVVAIFSHNDFVTIR